jgi:hypothetical protein
MPPEETAELIALNESIASMLRRWHGILDEARRRAASKG